MIKKYLMVGTSIGEEEVTDIVCKISDHCKKKWYNLTNFAIANTTQICLT